MPTKEGTNELIQYGLHAINFLRDFFEKAPQGVKDKLPLFLGLSLEDERRWGRLEAQFTEDEDKYIPMLLGAMEDYERDHFRYVVVGIPAGEAATEKSGSGKDTKPKTIPGTDYALGFLKKMAKLVKESSAEDVVKRLRLGGIIVEDPFSQQAITLWKDGVKWCNDKVLSQLEINSWKDLTPEKILAYDAKVAAMIDAYRLKGDSGDNSSKPAPVEIAGSLDMLTFGRSKKISNYIKEWWRK